MAKETKNNNTKQLTKKELESWLTYLAVEEQIKKPVSSKEELEKLKKLASEQQDPENLKQIEKISKKPTTVNNATTIANFFAVNETRELNQKVQLAQETISFLMFVLQEKLGVTDKDFESLTGKYQEMLENYKKDLEKEQNDKTKTEQETKSESKPENKSESKSEKVVKLNPND